MGHYASQCPTKKTAGGVTPQQKTPEGVSRSTPSCGKSVFVQFDSGATHSFISQECVSRLGLVARDLGCELAVSTPASGQVSTIWHVPIVLLRWQGTCSR